MTTLTVSIKHMRLEHEQPCGICGAAFVPAEDSGSRVFTMRAAQQEPFTALMCGGCYSKWSHGATATIRGTTLA